ncbi:MAG: hypothetical protein GX963_06920 [Bacteroidales bacterium]|nr:hypothetical protein [Bacteroidales bacterium]
MKEFIVYLFESGICISIFYFFYLFFFRRDTFFKFIRYYLIVGLLLSIIIPLFEISYDVIITPLTNYSLSNIAIDYNSNISENKIDKFYLCVILYMIGVLFFLVKFIIGIARIIELIKQGEKTTQNKYTLINGKNGKIDPLKTEEIDPLKLYA